MSMLCFLQILSPKQIEAVRGDEDLTQTITEAGYDEDSQPIADEPLAKWLELDHSWDIMRQLLLKFSVDDTEDWADILGGETIGDDVGYGEASLRDPAETEQFNRVLQSVDLDRLLSALNYREFLEMKLYGFPDGSEPDAVEEIREEMGTYYPALRDYVAKAAAAKHGLLIWLA